MGKAKRSQKSTARHCVLFALFLGFAAPQAEAWPWGRKRNRDTAHGYERRQEPTRPVPRAQPVIESPAPLEIPYYRDNEWAGVVSGTLDQTNMTIAEHFGQLETTGVGTLFGPISQYAKMSAAEKKSWIKSKQRPGTLLRKEPVHTSCVNFVLNQLRAGYEKAGKKARFDEIFKIVVANSGQGAVLLQELQKDGWTAVYWNPDVANPSTAVRTEQDKHNHRPSHHKWTAAEVRNKGKYLQGVEVHESDEKEAQLRQSYPQLDQAGLIQHRFSGIDVDPKNMVVNYRPTNPSRTTQDRVGIQKLYNAPMGVGIANGGYHVYLYSRGKIIESHSTRNPDDPTNIEVRDFFHWGQNKGEGFGSGVIMMPPSSWGKPELGT